MSNDAPFGKNITQRAISRGAEERLFSAHKTTGGDVTLWDYMGNDTMVERVATAGHGARVLPEQPTRKELLEHLAAKRLFRPFKAVQLKLRVTAPIVTALEQVYDASASVNEYSGRYSVMPEESFIPSIDVLVDGLRARGQEDAEGMASFFIQSLKEGRAISLQAYQQLLALDTARELARGTLGTDNNTIYVWKNDIFSISQLVEDVRARYEPSHPTRDAIEAIGEIAKETAPLSWRALTLRRPKSVDITMPADDLIVDGPLNGPTWEPGVTRRETSEGGEKHLFKRKFFLDRGEAQAVDYMGKDGSIAFAARTSYGRGTKTLTDDTRLVRSLVRDLHTTPTEMIEVGFESKAPTYSDPRQAGRHRTLPWFGFMGVVPAGGQFYTPAEEQWKQQDRVNRQGRGDVMSDHDRSSAREIYFGAMEGQRSLADDLRRKGLDEEHVRAGKGVAYYTKTWRTGNVHNWSHYLRLRIDAHAQHEIQEAAKPVAEMVRDHAPNFWQAFEDYRLNSVDLSPMDISVMRNMGILRFEAVSLSDEQRVALGRAGLPDEPIRSVIDISDATLYKGQGWVSRDEQGNAKLGREGLGLQRKLEMLQTRTQD